MHFQFSRIKPLIALLSSILLVFAVFQVNSRLYLGGPSHVLDTVGAVGNATYHGYPKKIELAVYWLSWFLMAVISGGLFLAGVYMERGDARSPHFDNFRLTVFSAKDFSCLFLFSFIYFVLSFPHFTGIVGAAQKVITPEFDGNNFKTWEFLYLQGWLPHKDYWYTYGTRYLFTRMYPPGILLSHAFGSLVFFTSGYLLGRLFGRSLLTLGLLLLLFVMLPNAGYGPALFRYSLPVLVVVGFFIQRANGYASTFLSPAILAAATSFVFYVETSLALYAAPAVMILLGESLLVKSTRAAALKFYLSFAAFFSLFLTVIIFYWEKTGQLSGIILFHRELSAASVYASVPSGIQLWMKSPRWDLDTLTLWIPFVGFLFSLFHLYKFKRAKSSGGYLFSLFCLLLSLANLVLYNKQILRPHISAQIIFPWVVFFIFLSARLEILFLLEKIKASAASFFIAIVFFWSLAPYGLGFWKDLNNQVLKTINIVKDVQLLVNGWSEWKNVTLTSATSARIPYLRQVEVLMNDNIPAGQRFYVFGDDSYLYPMRSVKPFFYINLYNSSPLIAQDKIINELSKISYIVFNSKFYKFDGVPNQLRLPLITKYIVENFEFHSNAGDFHLLKRVSEPRSNGVDYWLNVLGESIDLKSLPIVITENMGLKSSCHSSKFCYRYLLIKSKKTGFCEVNLPLSYKGHSSSYNLKFNCPENKDYLLPIFSLWASKFLDLKALGSLGDVVKLGFSERRAF